MRYCKSTLKHALKRSLSCALCITRCAVPTASDAHSESANRCAAHFSSKSAPARCKSMLDRLAVQVSRTHVVMKPHQTTSTTSICRLTYRHAREETLQLLHAFSLLCFVQPLRIDLQRQGFSHPSAPFSSRLCEPQQDRDVCRSWQPVSHCNSGRHTLVDKERRHCCVCCYCAKLYGRGSRAASEPSVLHEVARRTRYAHEARIQMPPVNSASQAM